MTSCDKKLKYTIRIREASTGKEVESHDDWIPWERDPTGEEGLHFMFADGNYSCDCNRKLFFGRAEDIEFSDEDTPCGHNQYFVRITLDETGKVVLDELGN